MERDRGALSVFLKERRARVDPRAVGLTATPLQRPGLTRAQVARLAGITSRWYALVETGRASGVSRRTLEAIARALALDDDDCKELEALAVRVYPSLAEQL